MSSLRITSVYILGYASRRYVSGDNHSNDTMESSNINLLAHGKWISGQQFRIVLNDIVFSSALREFVD